MRGKERFSAPEKAPSQTMRFSAGNLGGAGVHNRSGLAASFRLSGWLRLRESEQLRELGVEHPRRKKSGQSPVLEALRNDRIACLRFRRGECHEDGFAQTLRGEAIVACFGDDELLEVLHRLPLLGRFE